MSQPNQRRETRVDANVKVAIVRGRRVEPLETVDVSFKGLSLRMREPPALRSLVRLRVTLPTREIEVHAMAVHVSAATGDAPGANVGLQFWGHSGPERAVWDDFVRDLVHAQKAPRSRLPSVPDGDGPAQSGVRVSPEIDSRLLDLAIANAGD